MNAQEEMGRYFYALCKQCWYNPLITVSAWSKKKLKYCRNCRRKNG